jgi:hypothetical protein
MAPTLFKCPQTGMMVQHWLEDEWPSHEDAYEPVECPACTRLHFIHRTTGKLLGKNEE